MKGIVGVAPAVALVTGAALAACGDDASRDGLAVVATGDTYGEWTLLVEYQDGDWTGCLGLDHYGVVEECFDPATDELVTAESGEGARFGAVPPGAALEFADGDEVDLVDDRFFVVADDAGIHLVR
ncbi:MAG TPA: hypothetical protein VF152_14755 [Acidimicrobiia bacterium]